MNASTETNDPFDVLRVRRINVHGNPYAEGTPEYKAFAIGWDVGREQLMRDVTTADPLKCAALFTKHFILMQPKVFERRMKHERKHAEELKKARRTVKSWKKRAR